MQKRMKTTLENKLFDLFSRHFETLPSNQWADEKERWLELVVCTLFAFGGSGCGNARRAGQILAELGFLEIESLAALPIRRGIIASDGPAVTTMTQVLLQVGFTGRDASQALIRIVMLAKAFCSRFQGKIQRYLRSYGETMLDQLQAELPEIFVSRKNAAKREKTLWRFAFAMWLQNSLTLPVFLDTANTRRFCLQAGCRKVDLQGAADRLDINASLLDDLIDLWAIEEDGTRISNRKGG